MLYEIRNYHIRPDAFAAYANWAKTAAVPYLAKTLDLAGFWLNTADAPILNGEPMDALGSANVTWILRWRDRADRETRLPRAFGGAEWDAVFAKLPGGFDNYLRMESKFAESLT